MGALFLILAGLLQAQGYDLVFAGGRVADGSGKPMVTADVGVRGDRIAAVGDLSAATARRRIDARGLVLAPGFIDMLGWSEYNVLVDNRAASNAAAHTTDCSLNGRVSNKTARTKPLPRVTFR